MVAVVLKGDSWSSNLVVVSCYNQKPFYMISHSCESMSWTLVTKKVWAWPSRWSSISPSYSGISPMTTISRWISQMTIISRWTIMMLLTNLDLPIVSCASSTTSSGGGHCSFGDMRCPLSMCPTRGRPQWVLATKEVPPKEQSKGCEC